jgi:hypothetical protein
MIEGSGEETMTERGYGLLGCVLVVCFTAACGGGEQKKSEGTAAQSPQTVSSETGDFARDIEQMAGGVADASANFADDLMGLAERKPDRPRVEALAAALKTAVQGRVLTPAHRDALASGILTAAKWGDATKARSDIEATLSSAGAPVDAVSGVGNAIAQLYVR